MISLAFQEEIYNKIHDLYDISNNNPIFDENGIHVNNLKKYWLKMNPEKYVRLDRKSGEHAEFLMDRYNISNEHIFDRKLFYDTYWNINDIGRDKFIKNKNLFLIGYFIPDYSNLDPNKNHLLSYSTIDSKYFNQSSQVFSIVTFVRYQG